MALSGQGDLCVLFWGDIAYLGMVLSESHQSCVHPFSHAVPAYRTVFCRMSIKNLLRIQHFSSLTTRRTGEDFFGPLGEDTPQQGRFERRDRACRAGRRDTGKAKGGRHGIEREDPLQLPPLYQFGRRLCDGRPRPRQCCK